MTTKFIRITILIFVLLVCVGCDQSSKLLARRILADSPPLSYFRNTLRFEYTENPGAFLSLGATLPEYAQFWIFTVCVSAILTGLLAYSLWNSTKFPLVQIFAIALLIGGGLGNLIDRLLHDGRVIDFLNVGIGSLRTGIFNVADMAIMFGVFLMFVSLVRLEISD
ncbi:signal peptidase II [Chloroflexi bacterium TSY]|nr:signal peptidase II [Chloroflexi bacterium TSY]